MRPSANDAFGPSSAGAPDLGVSGVARGRLLVVDDEPMVVRAVSQILARAGFEILTASGPSEAEAAFARADGQIDLLLTDVVMPEGGGPRLAAELTARRPGLPVLFMSGYTGHESIAGDRQLPGPLLSKPFTAARLEAAVRDALAPSGD